ncbi:Hypothetical Protein FCC1311_004632 [Hondaea fermentalgiana]|uniref:Uncharacterized protein n=1 Tax=Hondaea fermentalgiana TaxID=2315210 RepID=A0A2R5G139_9STRA|nr:Hypothetical Protein FCC1311_004632 [Hondaea fermentalgiana]|eukprot:GBG24245.1 Hypothetical Protein FCC1311_004632 [Hondaea fermentalgiana]
MDADSHGAEQQHHTLVEHPEHPHDSVAHSHNNGQDQAMGEQDHVQQGEQDNEAVHERRQNEDSNGRANANAGNEIAPSVDELQKVLGWDPESLATLPDLSARENNKLLRVEDPAGWKAMEDMLQESIVTIAKTLCPANAMDLVYDVAAKILKQNAQTEVSTRKEIRNVTNALATIIEKSPRRTVQRRVAHAVLVKGLQLKTITQLRDEKGFTLGSSTREKAYLDFRRMASGEILQRSVISRTTFNADGLEEAVRFLLSEENLSKLSWSNHTIHLSARESVELPVLIRRKPECQIYGSYVIHSSNNGDASKPKAAISRSSFYKLLSLLTVGSADETEVDPNKDAWTGMLVDDPCVLMHRIIEDFSVDPKLHEYLKRQLSIAQNFLKQKFHDHVSKQFPPEVCFHDLTYALTQPVSASTVSSAHNVRCNACKFAFFLIHNLHRCIEESTAGRSDAAKADARFALHNVQKKFLLYYAYQLRAINHERVIKSFDEAMRLETEQTRSSSTSAIITADWNRGAVYPSVGDAAILPDAGVLWHCIRCDFYVWADGRAIKQTIYADQIIDAPVDGNVSAVTMATCMEAFLAQLHSEAPHIKSLTIRHFEEPSPQLVFLLALINTRGTLHIDRVIREESRKDQGPLARHFAHGRVHLKRFAKRSVPGKVRCIITARGVAGALAWGGGVSNSIVQLVRLDRQGLEATCAAFARVATEFASFAGRAAEIQFLKSKDDTEPLLTPNDVRTSKQALLFKVWSHPQVGPGIDVTIHIEAGTLGFTDKELAMRELKDCGLVDVEYAVSEQDQEHQDHQHQNHQHQHLGDHVPADVSHMQHAEQQQDQFVPTILSPPPPPAFPGMARGVPAAVDKDVSTADGDFDYFLARPETVPTEEAAQDADSDVDDDLDAEHAPSAISGYGTAHFSDETSVTGVSIIRCSSAVSLLQRYTEEGAHSSSGPAPDLLPQRRDLIATAVRHAKNLLLEGFLNVQEGDESLPDFEAAGNVPELDVLIMQAQGWARRGLPEESPFGQSFANLCRQDLRGILRNLTVAPLEVSSALIRAQPELYRLPGPFEIKKLIERCDGEGDQGRARHADPGDANERPRKRGRPCQIPHQVDDFLQSKIHGNADVRPRDLLNAVKAQFGKHGAVNEDFPDDRKLKQRIAGLKKAHKKRHVHGV